MEEICTFFVKTTVNVKKLVDWFHRNFSKKLCWSWSQESLHYSHIFQHCVISTIFHKVFITWRRSSSWKASTALPKIFVLNQRDLGATKGLLLLMDRVAEFAWPPWSDEAEAGVWFSLFVLLFTALFGVSEVLLTGAIFDWLEERVECGNNMFDEICFWNNMKAVDEVNLRVKLKWR